MEKLCLVDNSLDNYTRIEMIRNKLNDMDLLGPPELSALTSILEHRYEQGNFKKCFEYSMSLIK